MNIVTLKFVSKTLCNNQYCNNQILSQRNFKECITNVYKVGMKSLL